MALEALSVVLEIILTPVILVLTPKLRSIIIPSAPVLVVIVTILVLYYVIE
jgi:hypothetical protein